MASLLLAILLSAPAFAQQNSQVMVDLVVQIQQLQDEVRMLRGMLEDQSADLENLRDRQRDQYLDLDARINELRSGGPSLALTPEMGGDPGGDAMPGGDVIQVEPALQLGGSVTSPAQAAPREEAPYVRPAITTSSSVTAIGVPQTSARNAAVSPEVEKAAYDNAFLSLKELRYADAADQFKSFLERYPNSEYADNAQYWLGESYYVTRNYDIALEAFEGLLANYPNSPKIADGLLKTGYTHYELKQWDRARAALTQVQEQYPDTTLARLAGSRLRSMKLEGHF
jgi:tol-pal system protein YbgF